MKQNSFPDPVIRNNSPTFKQLQLGNRSLDYHQINNTLQQFRASSKPEGSELIAPLWFVAEGKKQ